MALDADLPDALGEPEFDEESSSAGTGASDPRRLERLAALGRVFAEKRNTAVTARAKSGIEKTWAACEEAYLGIDDVNRHEHGETRWSKPTSSSGGLTADDGKKTNKATAFVPLTARYVDMAKAKVAELLLPVDDKAFSLDAPSSATLADQGAPDGAVDAQAMQGEAGAAQGVAQPGQPPQPVAPGAPAAAMPGAQPAPAPTPGGAANPMTPPADAVQTLLADLKAKAKKAEDWIYDRLKESKYPKLMRRVLFDSARIGVGVLRGPLPKLVKNQKLSVKDGAALLEIEEKIVPGCDWIDPWNLFPAAGCGEDVHDGDHLFERDYLSGGKLQALKELKDADGNPLYLADQIDLVLQEGPGRCNVPAPDGAKADPDKRQTHFEVWTMYGTLDSDDFADMQMSAAKDMPEKLVSVHAIITLVNDTVIRATLSPLESGRFPFRVVPWSRRAGHWAGIGVGERVKFPQELVNAATRAIINNAGKSAGLHIAIDRRQIAPADGSWDMNVGDKIWEFTGEGLVDDIRKIFFTYQIPNLTAELMPLVEKAEKMAEEATGISLQTQGHAGKFDPDTFGQAELQDDNAHTLLRDLAYEVDDTCTEPLVTDFFEFYMLDPSVPDTDKALFTINARGSTAMVEKVVQEATFPGLINMALNPAFGQNPKKLFASYMRSKRLDPTETAYTAAELAAMPPPPPPPQVQVAQINAGTKLHTVDMQGQQRLQELQASAQLDEQRLVQGGSTPHEASSMARIRDSEIRAETARYVEDSRARAEAARAEKELEVAQTDGNFRLRELEAQREILLLEYANKQNLTLMQVKGQLANTALQMRAKHQLQDTAHAFQAQESDVGHAVDLHKHHTQLAAHVQAAQDAADATREAAATPDPAPVMPDGPAE